MLASHLSDLESDDISEDEPIQDEFDESQDSLEFSDSPEMEDPSAENPMEEADDLIEI